MIKIALVDDHAMLRKGLAEMLTGNGFSVLFEAGNGKECIEKMQNNNLPEIVLMDINMPLMNGFETTRWIKNSYPSVKVLALSMYDTEENIIKMFRSGACGYMLKDNESDDLIEALHNIHDKGFYSTDLLSVKMIKALNRDKQSKQNNILYTNITEREAEFLKLCCEEMGYKEIAIKMQLSQRTVDGYRESLFDKLNIKTRIGLVIYAIKNGLYKV